MDPNRPFTVKEIGDTSKDLSDAERVKKASKIGSDSLHCPSCGSILRYDPCCGKLVCEHCGSRRDMPRAVPVMPRVYDEDTEQGFVAWDGVKSIKCGGCGATSVLKDYHTSLICPFCGATEVVSIDDVPGLKPNGILPFRIGAKQAHHSFIKWLRSKIFAPHKVKKEAKHGELTGIYLPTFAFGAHYKATYEGRIGKHYTVTVGSGKNRRTEIRTRWFYISGDFYADYNDVHIEASSYLTQRDMVNLGGYDVANAVEYDDDYLAGFVSERYTESLDGSWKEAKEIMDSNARASILSRYTYDCCDYLDVSRTLSDRSYKYVLVPMWSASYKYKDKIYGFAVNGRNGRVKGKFPVSGFRVFVAALLGAALIAVLACLMLGVF